MLIILFSKPYELSCVVSSVQNLVVPHFSMILLVMLGSMSYCPPV